MSSFDCDGIEFAYEVIGADRPPLIFSHGLGGSMEHVREIAAGFPARVILYDNRSHGRTVPASASASLTFQRMAADMACVLDHLRVDRAFVGGVSMGAGIALAFARAYPERVEGLVLSRPAWLDRPFPANLVFAPVLADLIERHGVARAAELFRETECCRALAAMSREAAESVCAAVLEVTDPAKVVAAYNAIPASTPVESMSELQQMRMPALVIGTQDDPIHPVFIAERWADQLPHAELRIIPSRYADPVGYLRGFQAAVAEFLNRTNR